MIRSARFFLFVLALLLCVPPPSQGCVGRILYIGSLESPEERVMSELLVLLINERTGTTVQTRFFKTPEALYKALGSDKEEERADILVENTAAGLARLKKSGGQPGDGDYLTAKDLYEKELGLIWLNPFGYTTAGAKGGKSVSAPVIRRDVLNNFPLLPRVLNKLAGGVDNAAFAALLAKSNSGEKPKNIAKDFLKAKKFI